MGSEMCIRDSEEAVVKEREGLLEEVGDSADIVFE